jgi:HEAT repeat protein
LVISGIGITLALINTFTLQSDIRTAVGPQSDGQKQFFIAAADRPDIAVFFKNLKPEERISVAQNIARHDDPKLATLIAKLLADFDVEARAELGKSLTKLAKTQPQAVADQLKERGSFQQLAITQSIQSLGSSAIPYVIKTLEVADARTNAVSFLVSQGSPSVPAVLPLLKGENKDIVLSAADALGKLKAQDASLQLQALYKSAVPADRAAFLTALSSIGDARNEFIFREVLADAREPLPLRSQSALGLGRIGSASATQLLWQYAYADERELANSSISGLQFSGDSALAGRTTFDLVTAKVASGIKGPLADRALAQALRNQSITAEVASLCTERPTLVGSLMATLQKLNLAEQGDVADALLRSLLTTDTGKGKVEASKSADPILAALVARRESGA